MSLSQLLPRRLTIVEVGPRDGLQGEARILPSATKVEFIERLAAAGTRIVEATSFVNPQTAPQLADAEDVLKALRRKPGVRYPVLVPNETGLERALAAGADEIAVFGSASETYSRKNLNRSRSEALAMFRPVVRRAKDARMRVRAYLSMVIADPWEGELAPQEVVDAGRRLLDLGCDELSLGDTTGVGTPASVERLLRAYLAANIPVTRLAVHFHDTYGQGLANVLTALTLGVSVVDASAGGLGGSTALEGAHGNLATEDLLWLCRGSGIETGIDLESVAGTSAWIARELGRPIAGRAARAIAGDG